jgi:hypothetical protein
VHRFAASSVLRQGGNSTAQPISQTMAPGVALQAGRTRARTPPASPRIRSFRQIHVRGDHANLQYRLNGIILPEGLNVFGQVFQTRLAHLVSLITGALPAQ